MQTQKPLSPQVRATPSYSIRALGVLLALCLLCCFIPDSRGHTVWFASFFLVPLSTWALLYSFRCAVHADSHGLRWRGMLGDWQQARWDEVEDYFHANDKSGNAMSVVAFRDGRTLRLGSDWNDRRRVEALIAERATRAKASGWLNRSQHGTITGKHVFTYSDKSLRHMRIAGALVVCFALVFALTPLRCSKENLGKWVGSFSRESKPASWWPVPCWEFVR